MPTQFERPSWDEYFMLQAELAKLRSNCMTRKVGAVIVRDHRQIATGYNGTPPGIKNCFEGGCKRCQDRMDGKIKSGASLDRCLCNHAEANAIMHCAILGIEAGTKDAILYSTFVPCLECSKMAITIGIKKIICLDDYPETDYGLIKESGADVVATANPGCFMQLENGVKREGLNVEVKYVTDLLSEAYMKEK